MPQIIYLTLLYHLLELPFSLFFHPVHRSLYLSGLAQLIRDYVKAE